MNKLILSAALLAAIGAPFAASAQATQQITFTGKITKAACSVNKSSSAGVNGEKTAASESIAVELPTISLDDMNTYTTASVTVNPKSAPIPIKLTFSCGTNSSTAAQQNFQLVFNATAGSGYANGNTKLLAMASGSEAKGVAIAIHDSKGQVVDLSNSSPSITGKTAAPSELDLRASVVKVSSNAADLKEGTYSAVLPFTISYF